MSEEQGTARPIVKYINGEQSTARPIGLRGYFIAFLAIPLVENKKKFIFIRMKGLMERWAKNAS